MLNLTELEPAALAEQLLALPLLGAARREVLRALPRLATAVALRPDPTLEAHLLALGGALALQDGRPDAARQLAEAARAYAQAGFEERAMVLRFQAARALARAGHPAQAEARLEALGAPPEGWAAARAEQQITAANVLVDEQGGARRALLEAALAAAPSPGRDHDRLELHLSLAELHLEGGDATRARAEVERAAALAATHGDNVASCLVDAMLGDLLIEAGLPAEALAPLQRAVEAADALGDDITLVAQGSVLCAVQLEAADWEGAERSARRVLGAAERRGNWLGVADGAMSWATSLVERGAWSAAVAILLRTARVLRERAHEPSVNLIKARLAELRGRLGPDEFDPLLREISARV